MGQGKVRPSVAGDFYRMEGISAEEQREYKVQMKYAN